MAARRNVAAKHSYVRTARDRAISMMIVAARAAASSSAGAAGRRQDVQSRLDLTRILVDVRNAGMSTIALIAIYARGTADLASSTHIPTKLATPR